jgi:hypothetical protein
MGDMAQPAMHSQLRHEGRQMAARNTFRNVTYANKTFLVAMGTWAWTIVAAMSNAASAGQATATVACPQALRNPAPNPSCFNHGEPGGQAGCAVLHVTLPLNTNFKLPIQFFSNAGEPKDTPTLHPVQQDAVQANLEIQCCSIQHATVIDIFAICRNLDGAQTRTAKMIVEFP